MSEKKPASLATTVSQFVTFLILVWFYAGGRSVIKIRLSAFRPGCWALPESTPPSPPRMF